MHRLTVKGNDLLRTLDGGSTLKQYKCRRPKRSGVMLVLKLMRREAFASARLTVLYIRLALVDVIVDYRVPEGQQHSAN